MDKYAIGISLGTGESQFYRWVKVEILYNGTFSMTEVNNIFDRTLFDTVEEAIPVMLHYKNVSMFFPHLIKANHYKGGKKIEMNNFIIEN